MMMVMVIITPANFSFIEMLLDGLSPLCALSLLPILQVTCLSFNFHNFKLMCQRAHEIESSLQMQCFLTPDL